MPSLALAFALLAGPAAFQEDTRFDRVHLRNGNFLDGRIVKTSTNEIVLKLKVGEMTVRRDLIERIEQISMGSVTPPPPPPPRPGPKPPGEARAPAPPAETGLQKKAAAILEEIRRSDLESRPAVVEKLQPLGEEGAVFLAGQLPALDPATMPYVGSFLARAKEPKTAPILIGHLKHPKPAVRAVSAGALGGFGDGAPVTELLAMLADPDAGVRYAALGAARAVAPRDGFVPVARLTMDPSGEIRAQAVEALFEIARKHGMERDVASTLAPNLDRVGGPARATVASALGRAGDKQAWSALVPVLRDDSAEVRAAAAQALETLAAPEAGDAVLSAVRAERDKKVRIRLAAAADKLRLLEAGKAMIAWLDEDDAELKEGTVRALRSMTGKSFGPDRRTWEAYWESAKPK